MFIANIEYDRPVRWTRYTGDYTSWTNLYDEDLTNSKLILSLQDSTTGDIYEDKIIEVPLTIIEGPVGGQTNPIGDQDRVIFEFIVPKPTFSLPEGSNYFVEWYDPEEGPVDWYEFNISDKTGEEPIEWVVPFE